MKDMDHKTAAAIAYINTLLGEDGPPEIGRRTRARLAQEWGTVRDFLAAGEDDRVVFETTESFVISGKGRVCVGPYPFDDDHDSVIGRTVYVDGQPMIVRGVEWNLVHRPKLGDQVGMLLKRPGQ